MTKRHDLECTIVAGFGSGNRTDIILLCAVAVQSIDTVPFRFDSIWGGHDMTRRRFSMKSQRSSNRALNETRPALPRERANRKGKRRTGESSMAYDSPSRRASSLPRMREHCAAACDDDDVHRLTSESKAP